MKFSEGNFRKCWFVLMAFADKKDEDQNQKPHYYAVLGVTKDADRKTIKKAFRFILMLRITICFCRQITVTFHFDFMAQDISIEMAS